MFFETTMHKRRRVADANEAAHLIHTHQAADYEALSWTAPDGRELLVVADNHCDNPWKEVAVIDATNRSQIESITMGWIDAENDKADQLRECETTDFRMSRNGVVSIPLDGEGGETHAWFRCGCCGEDFESSYAKQKKFDQDNGYGICGSCCHRFQR